MSLMGEQGATKQPPLLRSPDGPHLLSKASSYCKRTVENHKVLKRRHQML